MRRQKEQLWIKIIRILLACVFIFSGLTKAINPLDFGFKIEEYFTSFNMAFMHPFAIYIAVLAIIAEFTLGFMLLFRVFVNLTAIGYLLFMVFFFFLTLWLAVAEHLEINYGYYFGVVTDCGCFGKAIKMTNLATFLKNVAIMIPTIIVFVKRKDIPDVRLTLLGRCFLAAIGALIVIGLQWYCNRNLPIVDFSDWKKGNNVEEIFIDKPAQKDIVFVYRNVTNDSIVILTTDELNSITDQNSKFYDEYDFVDRHDSIIVPLAHALIQGFNMLDTLHLDHAPTLLSSSKDAVYILFMHDLDEVNLKGVHSEKLLQLIAKCQEESIDFVAVTNSPDFEIAAFIAEHNIPYPIYHNPIDPIKGPFIVRDAIYSNPGLILLKNGVVVNKWAWRNFPK